MLVTQTNNYYMTKLQNYVSEQHFDTESMDLDLQIQAGGNIENTIENEQCINYIKEMFKNTNSMYTNYYCYFVYVFQSDLYMFVIKQCPLDHSVLASIGYITNNIKRIPILYHQDLTI